MGDEATHRLFCSKFVAFLLASLRPMFVNFAAFLLLMYVNTKFVLMMIVILATELSMSLLQIFCIRKKLGHAARVLQD